MKGGKQHRLDSFRSRERLRPIEASKLIRAMVSKPNLTDETEKYKRFSQMGDYSQNIIESL
jgi:hypothetical protein